MERYGIGLDIGISSVGWAAVALNEEEKPIAILDMGARVFDAAEQPKTGASLAAPRREARSARRRLRRHRHRNERIRQLIVRMGLLSEEELARLFDGRLEDIYALRVRALDEAVDRRAFARILLHLSQRRGFRSNRKNAADKEDGKILAAVTENLRRMEAGGYRTAGEMLFKDPAFARQKRNKGGDYMTTVTRDMVAEEAKRIFAAQRGFGCAFASEALEAAYLEILLSQRSFDEGPGGNSPYGGSQIERMVGKCTFFPEEPRAARAAYSFEYFSLLQKVNHIRLLKDGESVPLSDEQRRALVRLAHESAALDFARIRKTLAIAPEYRFNTVPYRVESEPAAAEKKEKFNHLKSYHAMRTAIDRNGKGRFALLTCEQRDAAGTILTLYKAEDRVRGELEKAGFEPCDVESLLGCSFSKFGHISLRACRALIPYLEQGMNYNEACGAAGFAFKGHEGSERSRLLHPTEDDLADITSPVVRRAVSQTVKVLNAIIRRYGESPTFLNIELAREMAKDFSERKTMEKEMRDNQARNDRLMERIRGEYGVVNAGGLDLVKLRLYEEQGGVCAYSLRPISMERLFEPNYTEVDHIIPYSISFDDSRRNKVLVLTEENRNKGNRLPLQYLSGQRREDFIVWVNSSVRDWRKRQKLLKERITPEDEAQFKERNLQDTKTMARFLMNYINDHLAFAESPRRRKRVTAVNGSVTSYLRKRWGINKNRADGDLHHAVDALVIACTTDGMIQQLSRYAVYRECRYMQTEGGSLAVDESSGEVLREFPYPWPQFRRELDARLSPDPAKAVRDLKLPFYYESGRTLPKPLFVSRMPRRKVTGAAHKDTVKSPKAMDEGLVVVKRPLSELKLKDGEIENYYRPESDRLLYEALRDRLAAFDGNGAKAFAEPFYKPKHDGTPGPLVRKVKLCEPSTLNVAVHGGSGVADNDSLVRIDVFHVEGDGYYFVPVYVADTLKPALPNLACVAHRPYAEWKPMREEDFLFSLYPNDLIRVTQRKGIKLNKANQESSLPESVTVKEDLLYYVSADISSGSINCCNHDNSYKKKGMGVKTLEKLEKCSVDVLGEVHTVEKEPRIPFTQKRS